MVFKLDNLLPKLAPLLRMVCDKTTEPPPAQSVSQDIWTAPYSPNLIKTTFVQSLLLKTTKYVTYTKKSEKKEFVYYLLKTRSQLMQTMMDRIWIAYLGP